MDIREFISEQTTKKNRTNKNPPPSFYSVRPFSHIIFQNGLRSFSQSSFCACGFSSRSHTLQFVWEVFERRCRAHAFAPACVLLCVSGGLSPLPDSVNDRPSLSEKAVKVVKENPKIGKRKGTHKQNKGAIQSYKQIVSSELAHMICGGPISGTITINRITHFF